MTLNCSVEGGNPMDYTVQWMKDGQQLASTTSVPGVLVYTSPHYQQQFGVFTCSAINQYYHINKTVLIQERGKRLLDICSVFIVVMQTPSKDCGCLVILVRV